MHAILFTGAALIGMPILLHLIMRQEPKRQPLPTFRFLKMKRRINERKIRLRHWLLLAMRMLLIGLTALALFQPTLLSNRFNIRGEQPVAAVIVLDTSASMGYILAERSGLTEAQQRGLKLLEETTTGSWTMLDEARGRAMELLDELPPNSKVAIIDTSERLVDWSPTAFDARKKIQSIKKTRGNSQTVSRGVEQAYGLFARLDTTTPTDSGPLPRLLVVLSDREGPSWDASRVDDLKSLREKIPPPEVFQIYLDVGIDKPVNMAIRDVSMESAMLDPRDEAIIRVVVEATGQAAENIISCRFDAENETEKKPINLQAGEQKTIEFRRSRIKEGLHTAEIKLETADALPFDNIRYLTFSVREPRKVLAIADGSARIGALGGGATELIKADLEANPFRKELDLYHYIRAFGSVRSVSSDLVLSENVDVWQTPESEMARYEAVILCGLKSPSEKLWNSLKSYLEQGGRVLIFPDGSEQDKLAYNNIVAQSILPGTFEKWIERPEMDIGWDWAGMRYEHPLLAPFKDWRKDPGINFVKTPPLVKRYWQVQPLNNQTIVARFADGANSEGGNPAILERAVGTGVRRGLVMMYAMTFNARQTSGTANQQFDLYDNYSQTSFHLVLSTLTMRYLVGENENFERVNYYTGQMAVVRWPTEPSRNAKPFYLSGPDVSNTDSQITRDPKENYFRLPAEKTVTPGNYSLSSEDKTWVDGFSLNIPPEESRLERVPVEAIEPIFGKEGITPVGKQFKLREILKGNMTQPVELFPFLMVLLLLFMAFENLLANKFYRS